MMSPAYKKAAHRRAVLKQLQRMLSDFLDADMPARETILCEDVFFADRVVPQDSLLDVLATLQLLEEHETKAMGKFVMRERESEHMAPPAPRSAQPAAPPPAKKKLGRPPGAKPKAKKTKAVNEVETADGSAEAAPNQKP